MLGIARSQEEVLGWMIPDLYFNYLEEGDARPLAGVFYHNAMDIVSLASLFELGTFLINAPNSEDVFGIESIAIAKIYEELEDYSTASQLYEKGLRSGLPKDLYIQNSNSIRPNESKNNQWSEAIELWKKAANADQAEACIELAKYFEHQEKNYAEAMTWAKLALAIVKKSKDPFDQHC